MNKQIQLNNVPLGTIKPKGFLLQLLKKQSVGLTGKLEEIWNDVGSDSGWLGGNGEDWERGPYYCDGLIPLSILLDKPELKEKAEKWVSWTINSQEKSGFFGPKQNRDWWPRMVMLKVLIQYYEYANDNDILDFMNKYFLYQLKELDSFRFTALAAARGGENLYSVLWLYSITKEDYLLELAKKIERQTLNWTNIFLHFPFVKDTGFYYDWEIIKNHDWNEIVQIMRFHETHGVNVAMALKTPALLYCLYGNDHYKKAVYRGVDALFHHHGVCTGVFTGDEHLAGTNPSRGIELCSVVEFMFSMQVICCLLQDPFFIDLMEKAAYNGLLAAISEDFLTHQYVQQPNQVVISTEKRSFFNVGNDANTFGLEPYFGCCTANLHQGWPKFTANYWKSDTEGNLIAMAYGMNTLEIQYNNTPLIMHEITNYPFDHEIKFLCECKQCIAFPLMLRLPKWNRGFTLSINEKSFYNYTVIKQGRGEFIRLYREWENDDILSITFLSVTETTTWPNTSISLEYGPLVFALPIPDKKVSVNNGNSIPNLEFFPKEPWNYAIGLNCENRNKIGYQIVKDKKTKLSVKINCRELLSWSLEAGSAAKPVASPIDKRKLGTEIQKTLVPYGLTTLRISQFPWYIRNDNVETGEYSL